MALASIPVARVELGRRLREISEAQVVALMASIGDVGLLNPITVYPRKVLEAGISVDGYGVVAGAHRLEACKRLGHAEIAAQVVGLSELERQIAECDENLCGTTLTASERATFTRRRKEAYEALHPETRHGGDKASRKVCDLDAPARFTADTAARTGQSERKVQLDAERGSKVCQEALDILKGTKADTGTVLDRLKDLTPEQQIIAARDEVNRRASKPKGTPREPKVADAPESDEAALERQVHALMAAWNKAAPDARREFLSRIDSAVMDQGGWG